MQSSIDIQFREFEERIQQSESLRKMSTNFVGRLLTLYCNYAKKKDSFVRPKAMENFFEHRLSQCSKLILQFKKYQLYFSTLHKQTSSNLKRITTNFKKPFRAIPSQLIEQCHQFLTSVKNYHKKEIKSKQLYNKYTKKCHDLHKTVTIFMQIKQPINFYDQSKFQTAHSLLTEKLNKCIQLEQRLNVDTFTMQGQLKNIHGGGKAVLEQFVKLMQQHLKDLKVLAEGFMSRQQQRQGEFEESRIWLMDEDVVGRFRQIRTETYLQTQNAVGQKLAQECDKPVNINLSMKKLSMKEMEELIKKEEREVNDLILLQQQVVVELAYQDKNSRIVQTEINYLKQEAKEIISLFDRYSACFGKSFFQLHQLMLQMGDHCLKQLERDSNECCLNKLKRAIQGKRKLVSQCKVKVQKALNQSRRPSQSTLEHMYVQELQQVYKNLKESSQSLDTIFSKTLQDHFSYLLTQNYSNSYSLAGPLLPANVLAEVNVDEEITRILVSDKLYNIFFPANLELPLSKSFISQIPFEGCQQAQNWIHKKEKVFVELPSTRSCCWGHSFSEHAQSSVQIVIRKGLESITGTLFLMNYYLLFQENCLNPFGKRLQLIIPKEDILYLRFNEDKPECLYLETEVGKISLESEKYSDICLHFKEAFLIVATAQNQLNKLKLKTISDLQKNSQRKSSSTQTKVARYSSSKTKESLSNELMETKFKEENVLGQLVSKWQKSIFFSKNFVPLMPRLNTQQREYQFNEGIYSFLLRENKDCTIKTPQNLCLEYQWTMILASYTLPTFTCHSQIQVTIESSALVTIVITQDRIDQHMLTLIKLKQQLETMNHHLCDFIVMTTQREGEVTIKYVEEECSFLESIFFSIPALPNSPNVNDQYHNAEE